MPYRNDLRQQLAPPAQKESEKRVGLWIRVSTEEQAQGDSPEHHELRGKMYAERLDRCRGLPHGGHLRKIRHGIHRDGADDAGRRGRPHYRSHLL